MPNVIVVGTQWGDEGKAKVIDYLTERSHVIVRFQGGANAGHTVIAKDNKFVFHMVPSGIMYPDKTCIVGNGVVFDAEQFLSEVNELRDKSIEVKDRLFVSDQAHLVMPYHKIQDSASEKYKENSQIGTTKRGIGPAYADKAQRIGLRVGDLLNTDALAAKLKANLDLKKTLLENSYGASLNLKFKEVFDSYCAIAEMMRPYVADTARMLHESIRAKESMLFEGAQGTFLDIDHGTYPFVTSSNTVAGAACCGSGIGPTLIDYTVGIVKTYTTRVGNGPFPTELLDDTGELIRAQGQEFGATTGRPRRCGWFDSVMVRKAVQVNGLTHLALTKVDVLNCLEEVKICTHYEIDDEKTEHFPSNPNALERVTPVYESLPGWKEDISECKKLSEMPANAIKYIERLRELCYNIPILIVSMGPERTQTIEIETF
ncbi:MAG: adenylosuccinate synthase [Chitinivibrionales bacterium]|nr:adenylosuccinate synthase [Chitinivibrionales bacterium]